MVPHSAPLCHSTQILSRSRTSAMSLGKTANIPWKSSFNELRNVFFSLLGSWRRYNLQTLLNADRSPKIRLSLSSDHNFAPPYPLSRQFSLTLDHVMLKFTFLKKERNEERARERYRKVTVSGVGWLHGETWVTGEETWCLGGDKGQSLCNILTQLLLS